MRYEFRKPMLPMHLPSAFIIAWFSSTLSQTATVATRLIADVLAQRQDRPVFTWGGADLVRAGDFRRRCMHAARGRCT